MFVVYCLCQDKVDCYVVISDKWWLFHPLDCELLLLVDFSLFDYVMLSLSQLICYVRTKHILLKLYNYLPRIVRSIHRRWHLPHFPHRLIITLQQRKIHHNLTPHQLIRPHLLPRHTNNLKTTNLIHQLLLLLTKSYHHIRIIYFIISYLLVINHNQVTHLFIKVNDSLKSIMSNNLECTSISTFATIKNPCVIICCLLICRC